ncbi:hypothetical protein BD413DRAFT_504258 [Trametes elegans]|nr:hypothetical protein BD413DRAFT_504258 [Trametes elegans]
MSATFTPSNTIDPAKERDWPAQLGMLDWDSTNIVFTKRTLIEFLKYAGVTVDTNFSNIQKLPRYAKFGKITGGAVDAAETDPSASSDFVPAAQASAGAADFKPTRRVREPPGGAHHALFGGDAGEDDALARAPPKPATTAASATTSPDPQNGDAEAEDDTRPKSRRTTSSVASLWDAPEPANNGFKPTRRVREMPGGKDSISGLFGA